MVQEEFEEKKKMIEEFVGSKGYRSMSVKEMAMVLQVPSRDKKDFREVLDALAREGKISIDLKGKIKPLPADVKVGKYMATQRGFGFVRVEGEDDDIFIPGSYTKSALDGDTVQVLVKKEGGEGKRREGQVLNILERGNSVLVGTYTRSRNFGFVTPDNQKFTKDIYVAKAESKGAVTGHKVVVEITDFGDEQRKPEGRVLEILGHVNDPGVDILSVIKAYGLPEEYPDDVMKQIENIPDEVEEKEKAGRADFRDLQTVTIDGEDAKDLDDAITISKEGNMYHLGVHIADVSQYVTEGSPLDKEALKRGTSIYLVDRVIPMIPHKLSNGICSLNPKVDRLAFSALMEVDKDGRRYGAKFAKSVICSKARMTYNKVNKILAGDKGLREEYAFLVETAETMNNLAHALYKRRIERGALELDIPEAEIRVDENGKPVEIRFRERGESEKLIEEFMLQANEAVAEYMCKRELPTVYRVHENPDPDKLRVFASFARPFGYRIDPSKPEDTAQFQTVLRGAKNDPKQRVLPTLLLRSLARARYADECIGHYGLKAKFYLHFTSPIRRYPDLVAHRMLQKALLGEEFTAADETMCEEAADQSTNREQAADNCERDIDKLYIASYMQQFIGEEFDAEVSGVQSFGVFVALENGCEGLIRAELMTGDFYQYDEEHMAMVGRHTGKRFTIGTPMRVKLLAASDTTGQIDFAPADGSLPVSEKLDRPRREDTDRAPRGNRAERRRHSGKGRGGKPGKGKKPPTRKRR